MEVLILLLSLCGEPTTVIVSYGDVTASYKYDYYKFQDLLERSGVSEFKRIKLDSTMGGYCS